MPLLITVRDGHPDLTASTLNHDGATYTGPLFDVPPAVADELTRRAAFRYATADEIEQAAPKPKPRKKND